MILSIDRVVFLTIASGITFGLLRIFLHNFHQLKGKSLNILLSLPLLFVLILVLPDIEKSFGRDQDWFGLPLAVIAGVFIAWFLKFKKQVLPRFSQIHWIILPLSIPLLFIYFILGSLEPSMTLLFGLPTFCYCFCLSWV